MKPSSGSASADDRDAKRRRLIDLSHNKYISGAGLASTLNNVREHGLPDKSGRMTITRARQAACATHTPFGQLIQTVALPMPDGTTTEIHIQHPMAMLYDTCATSPGFADLMRASLARKPCTRETPWTLIIYNDEVGVSPLKHDTRKVESVYWSFLELGTVALSTEEAWFVISAPRSDIIHAAGAGFSTWMKALFPSFFNPLGHDLSNGIMLKLHGNNGVSVMLHATFQIFAADERAIKFLFGCKGSGGVKPCALCLNICKLGDPRSKTDGYALDISCFDIAKFKMASDESICAILRTLRDKMARGENVETEQSMWGWVYNPHNIMAMFEAAPCKPVANTMFDWMHIYLVDGIWNVELFFLLVYLKAKNVPVNVCGL
jgi:hypothetical protein